MHDSLTAQERAAIKASNPDSFLHVTRRAGDPGETSDPVDAATQGQAALDRLMAEGAFREIDEPSLLAYRLEEEGSSHTGFVAEVPVGAFERREVRGHEDVQPERVEALARSLEGVGAGSDPVALVFMPDALTTRSFRRITEGEQLLRIEQPELIQTVWRVDDDAARALSESFASTNMYVADGHHRVAASIVASKRMPDPARVGILCVVFPSDQLRILSFHRLVTGPVDEDDLISRMRQRWSVVAIGEPAPRPGAIEIRLGGRWLRAAPNDPGQKPGRKPGVAGLDVTRLHVEILEPLLGVKDAGDPRLELVPEVVPVGDLVSRADGTGGALFLLSPPGVDELIEVADRGEVVPPKTTYFSPKPRSGVFLRLG